MSSPNPFRAGLLSERPADLCIIVIFGASGDLARRKLFPALMHLAQDGSLPAGTVLLSVSRRDADLEAFRASVFDAARVFAPDLNLDPAFVRDFGSRIYTIAEDPEGRPFTRLPVLLRELAERHGTRGNVLYYLAVPPSSFDPIVREIGAGSLHRSPDGWVRIIVEKPFGRDLQSALALDQSLSAVFREGQVYRIDHYMGKEAVQNIFVMRLANSILEPLWNRQHIDHVQITAAESVGVEDRAAYYEEAGALRDMVQNHLLQILAMVAMEPPATLDPEAVRGEKAKVLQAIRPIPASELAANVIRAQYDSGAVAGRAVPAYLQERGVAPQSQIETYTALRLWIDNWRWQGVPFYLRTGKRLPKRITEVAIQFRPVPHQVFAASPVDLIEPNVLSIRIQPGEGITLKFLAKTPGHTLKLRPVGMEFRYGTSFGGRVADAYERLLLDAMLGDPTLFARRDAVLEGWKLATPILETWRHNGVPLARYAAGSWGPAEADQLLEADGRSWRRL